MVDLSKLTLPAIFADTLSKFEERPAMATVGEPSISYNQLRQRIKAITAFLENAGIVPGDKVAILSTSMPNWGAVYYAITFMGAVVVPVLPDFHASEISNILEHSESKAIFVSAGLMSKLTDENALKPFLKIRIEDFSIAGDESSLLFDAGAQPQREYAVNPDDLAAIIYTSGTTGKSKGVMLTHRNISFNAEMCGRVQEVNEKDRFLSILPLSHTYENTIGLILPMSKGACIYYLGKAPTPTVLLPALQQVKPTVMLTVPLIIEKIFRTQIKPKFTKNILLRILIHTLFIRRKLNVIAGRKLMATFGGELKFFGIGGAKLNKTVEKFLIEAKFPYAIGYGLTETSPLLAGSNPQNSRLQSTGPAIEEIELIIHDPDPRTHEGEIWARGPSVMKGYYKEPELTAQIITPDGWLKTGDLGIFDKDGYLYIRGRLKNMIVRSDGENIYPEEIESVINNFRHVTESLVVERKGKLVALVNFNLDEITRHHHHNLNLLRRKERGDYIKKEIDRLSSELLVYISHRLNKFSQVQEVILQTEPFEKTATQKIKRYLYI
ncbi:MAG TPA: AMP-binding protein [Bacteroidales bacterium]|nr:AMP-binding protein [Bacteroidales bacterium]